MFAQKQHKGYCRQTFIGGNYGLLENVGGRDLRPMVTARLELPGPWFLDPGKR